MLSKRPSRRVLAVPLPQPASTPAPDERAAPAPRAPVPMAGAGPPSGSDTTA